MPRKSTNYGQRFIGAEAHEDACLKMAKKGPSEATMDAIKEAAIRDDGADRRCSRCGEPLCVIGYVVVNADPNTRGIFCSDCIPFGVTVDHVKVS